MNNKKRLIIATVIIIIVIILGYYYANKEDNFFVIKEIKICNTPVGDSHISLKNEKLINEFNDKFQVLIKDENIKAIESDIKGWKYRVTIFYNGYSSDDYIFLEHLVNFDGKWHTMNHSAIRFLDEFFHDYNNNKRNNN
ncbi:hypothetical protein PV797_20175 [Clostridiaceae bacterium M8S5]|nr:hypothetical protein PV797_20175 [Clostridiaceae bacterium M8S5]